MMIGDNIKFVGKFVFRKIDANFKIIRNRYDK